MRFLLIGLFIGLLSGVVGLQAAVITQYSPQFQPFYNASGKLEIALRSYKKDGHSFHLAVVTDTLNTREISDEEFSKLHNKPIPLNCISTTRFMKLLKASTEAPYPLSNDGITRSLYPLRGFFLTMDLCPTSKPLVREIIKKLPTSNLPIPLGVSITGLWVKNHPEDLEWLKKQDQSGHLAITWINHSYSHPYHHKAVDTDNFLLTRGTDLNLEVLKAEEKMLENGIVPSVFFRFPGLISSRDLIAKVSALHLISLGADAWLAKGKNPSSGSVILVHGTGNEPLGVSKLVHLYPSINASVFLPLSKLIEP